MEETRTELQMIKMSEIQSQEVAWLWYPFIPYGKLTIVQGDPGDGKTTLVLNIAAKLSKGEGIVFCQVLFPEKSVGIPFFQQGIFPAFSGHYASLRMRACSIR